MMYTVLLLVVVWVNVGTSHEDHLSEMGFSCMLAGYSVIAFRAYLHPLLYSGWTL